jgi:hypothetical protein
MSVCLSVCPPARPYGTRLSLDRFAKILYLNIFRKSVKKIQVALQSDKNTIQEHQYTFTIISPSFLLTMRNASYKVVEKIKKHILCSLTFFFNRAVCEIMWKIVYSRTGQDDNIIRRMRIACCSECAVLVALPLHQRLHESASNIRYKYCACPVHISLPLMSSADTILQLPR